MTIEHATLLAEARPSFELAALGCLFDNLPLGLVVLDVTGRVVVYNRAEEQLAGRSRDKVLGSSFFEDVAPCMDVRELGAEFRNRIGRSAFDTTVEMSFAFPLPEGPRDVKVRMCSLDVGAQPFGFLLIEDISLRRSVDRMREQLQSLLVHDFKNPLAAIMLNLELMSEVASVRDSSDAMDSLVEALAATRRLNRMTVDLLDISRLETATMPLRRTRTDLQRMLARVCNDNAAAARAYRSRLHVTPGAADEAEIDEDLVVRALDNLVENAIRHAGNVTLSAAWAGDRVVLRVSDDGPGVPLELRERLFDKYVQVQTTPAARGLNRGLGLTFVKLVAQQHGGTAELACPPEGGTAITPRLTASRPAEPRALPG
jgi:photoactive yellow protein